MPIKKITILVTVLAIVLYSRILNTYFISDDYEWWSRVRGLDFINSFRLFLPPDLGGISFDPYFRSFVGWTVWINTVPLKMAPFVFHSTNLLFHSINAILVGCLAYLFFRKKIIVFFLAIIFFITFPFHAEAVTWSVGGRYDVVATTFYLLTTLFTIKYAESKKTIWPYFSCVAFVFALFSMESAVTIPFTVMAVLLIQDPSKALDVIRINKKYILSLFIILVVYVVGRSIYLKSANPFTDTSFVHLFTVSRFFIIYAFSLLFLIPLWKGIKILLKKYAPKILFLYLLVGVLYLPTAYLPTQERHLYLPSFALAILFAGLSYIVYARIKKNYILKWLLIFILLFAIVIDGFILFTKNERWRAAGVLAENLTVQIADLAQSAPLNDTLYFLNLPDNLDGVFVYRSRMKDAVEFRLKRKPPQMVFTPRIGGTSSTVSIVDKKTLRLTSIGGFLLFLPKKNSHGGLFVKTESYKATQIDKNALLVEFFDRNFDAYNSRIFYFQDGRIKSLKQ